MKKRRPMAQSQARRKFSKASGTSKMNLPAPRLRGGRRLA